MGDRCVSYELCGGWWQSVRYIKLGKIDLLIFEVRVIVMCSNSTTKYNLNTAICELQRSVEYNKYDVGKKLYLGI